MFKPRNTLVLVHLVKKEEEKVGAIVVKTDSDQFAEAEVVEVGPDCISAEGGEASTHDLKPGQRVLVQYQTIQRGPDGLMRGKRPQGLELKETLTGGKRNLFLFEQTAIMAILAEPKETK
jgi:co-chaperonin GroES (HSP10)